jgi:hypothetical protein
MMPNEQVQQPHYRLNRGGTLSAPSNRKSKRDTSYANFDQVQIPLDYRLIACGSTGTGKTTSVVSIIGKQACFHEVHLCTKMPDEASYAWLQDMYAKISKKTKRQHLFIYDDVSKMPSVDSFPDIPDEITYNRLVIFDDMQAEPPKKQSLMQTFFTRGRKKRFSGMYLCQNYFMCPKEIRTQCNIALFRSVDSDYDVKAIVKDFGLGVSKETFIQMFQEATKGWNFLLVDRHTTNPNLKFRMNLGDGAY